MQMEKTEMPEGLFDDVMLIVVIVVMAVLLFAVALDYREHGETKREEQEECDTKSTSSRKHND